MGALPPSQRALMEHRFWYSASSPTGQQSSRCPPPACHYQLPTAQLNHCLVWVDCTLPGGWGAGKALPCRPLRRRPRGVHSPRHDHGADHTRCHHSLFNRGISQNQPALSKEAGTGTATRHAPKTADEERGGVWLLAQQAALGPGPWSLILRGG